MAAGAVGDEAAPTTKAALTFLDLPAETQKEIVSHCSQSDLICIALVSKHFHVLASAQLYRNFHIIFPDDDDINFDSPIDGLAGGLDTFTTSDYNYARHLRDLSMDTLSSGLKGEHSYQSYLYSASCGKFLNTLLYLTLKRASSLEAFRWNIRVELTRPVYRELHRISSLKRLHIRMQAGNSYYNPPPPLPVSLDHHHGPIPNHWSSAIAPPPPPPGSSAVLSLPLTFPGTSPPMPSGPPPALVPPSKSLPRNRSGKRGLAASKEPSTLSGFRKLKSLCVLDIDNLDLVPELRTCVRNSYSTLTQLQLSLSDSLAIQARRPPPDSDADDSDADDEFQIVPASQNTSYDGAGPAKAFRAQEERKIQEGVLGCIFDVEQPRPKKLHLSSRSEENGLGNGKGKEGKQKEDDAEPGEQNDDPRDEFISSIKGVSGKLISLLSGSREFSPSQQEILDTIEKAARKYVASGEIPESAKAQDEMEKVMLEEEHDQSNNLPPSTDADDAGPSNAEDSDATPPKADDASGSSGPSETTDPTACDDPVSTTPKTKPHTGDVVPEDIDIEHDDTVEDTFEESDDQPAPNTAESVNENYKSPDQTNTTSASTPSIPLTFAASFNESRVATEKARKSLDAHEAKFQAMTVQLSQFETQSNILMARKKEMHSGNTGTDPALAKIIEEQVQELRKSIKSMYDNIKSMASDIEDSEKLLQHAGSQTALTEAKQLSINDYIRNTRGMSLESLSIHLIPVKASVLSRAINLGSLKELTLLNVGNQAPIWTLLSKENKTRPLALRSVFTDNVSPAFLACMAQLPELHDLFMLERSTKHKPETFAPRSVTTIDQIRRLVLKRHMPTLKRLMIKDESNSSNWDANEKTMILICARGQKLEELAVSMNIQSVHAFMQYFSGLVNLRAISILHFKNNDTCPWVMREILRFIVDNLSHHPELKLEWIGMEDDRVERVVRPSDTSNEGCASEPKKTAKGKNKSKGKGPADQAFNEEFPTFPVDAWDSGSDSDDSDFDSGRRLRFKTVGPLQFYDVWGVKIFDKEIRSGRL